MGALTRIAQGVVDAAWRATHQKAALPPGTDLTSVGGGWYNLIHESFTGAWQRNISVRADTALTNTTVFRCINLISSDVAKMRLRLVALTSDGIWIDAPDSPAHSPVLRKPNRFQTRPQFFQNWMESRLIWGNAYVLKERDARNVVVRMYVLNPQLVTPLVAPDGSVYYQLRTDYLSQVPEESTVVPASEIIHDRGPTFHHPLVGLSPIMAAGLAAIQGIRIQENSTRFFAGGSNPGGVLSAPGHITNETAARIKEYWDNKFGTGGTDVGKVAVLGDGLKYEPMMMTAVDSDLLNQLKWSAETVCAAFGVPAFMAGVGAAPTYNNIEALNSQYYSQCLQPYIENIEYLLDEGLELKTDALNRRLGTEFNLDDLIRMDSTAQMKVASDGVRSGILAPDEARRKFDLLPVKGGNTPYLQVQNFSLEALAERDQANVPISPAAAAPATQPRQPSSENMPNEIDDDDVDDMNESDEDDARAHHTAEILRRSQAYYVNKDAA